MENVWVHAKGTLWDPVVERLKDEGYWNTVIHRTHKPAIEELTSLRDSYSLPEEIIPRYEGFYKKLLDDRYLILDMLYRKTDWGTDRYNSASFHELSNRIRIYYEFYTFSLLKGNISLVVFWDTPHMGWDYILYRVAKFHNIKTLILDQSKFPNKFFHFFDYSDYGTFDGSIILENIERYEIEKKVEKDWFYMKKNRGQTTTYSLKKFLSLSKYKNRINAIIEDNDYLRLIKELIIKDRRSQSFFRFYTERNYKKELNNMVTAAYSLKTKFVYFPLHYQPEKVSTVWGGSYSDQVLAIETLSKRIPKDWYIYVKENPVQEGAYRDKLFFYRLKMIPNLMFLPKDADTFELTKNSQFISTIVGTVGWEAITGNKNVLLFGWGAWYKTLPGVYQYHDNLNIDDLVNNKIDHDDLEKKTGFLYNKCGTGIVREPYIPFVKNFSMEKNTETVVESLKRILYKTK